MKRKRRVAERQKKEAQRSGRERPASRLPASFTIEAALLVPVLLAVLFLLLQSILYLHDTVQAEVWLSEQAVRVRREAENDGRTVGERGTEDLPRLAVLRCRSDSVTKHLFSVRARAVFETRMLSGFASLFFGGPARERTGQVTEKIMDTPGFLRIAGAIQEELEE